MLIRELDQLFTCIADYPSLHARITPFWKTIDSATRYGFAELEDTFRASGRIELPEIGVITLPFYQMGEVSSLDLFGLDELIIFAFYWRNRDRYKKAVDIGANLGLHSIIMSKCGFLIRSFEPDALTFEWLVDNLRLNAIHTATPVMAAVSDRNGAARFTRVLDNTTSSHLVGAKANAYGSLEEFTVETCDMLEVIRDVDFVKIDAEGHEAVLIRRVPLDRWSTLDAIVEIGSAENAREIWNHLAENKAGVSVFCQKIGWNIARSLDDLPTSYRDGSVFISAKTAMPWDIPFE